MKFHGVLCEILQESWRLQEIYNPANHIVWGVYYCRICIRCHMTDITIRVKQLDIKIILKTGEQTHNKQK